jgi:FtsH-binding integral membrane protein
MRAIFLIALIATAVVAWMTPKDHLGWAFGLTLTIVFLGALFYAAWRSHRESG